MQKSNKTQLKRLIRKYEFLLEDFEEVDDIYHTANQAMSAEIHKHRPPEINPEDFEKDWEEEEKKDREEGDVPLKKLFRKIVIKCHPDRLPPDTPELRQIELMNLYNMAINAHDDNNWALMVVVAIKLDVDLPEEANDKIEEIEKETEELEQKINEKTSSVVWQWYHSEEELRQKILDNYLSLLSKAKSQGNEKPNLPTKLILGVGHPRTGTGYTAKLLKSWSLDVGHEELRFHGTVDWSLAGKGKSAWQNINFNDFDWQHIVYCVRNPKESIPSIVYTEDVSNNFRYDLGVEYDDNPIIATINSICKWDELITSLNPNIVYRIEDQGKILYDYLKENNINVRWNPKFINVKINTREHPNWDQMIDEFGEIPEKYLKNINEYCKKYMYDLIKI